MTQAMIEHVKNNPKYQQLVKTRSAFAWKLSIVMLVVYYAFILAIAFDPKLLGMPVSAGSVTTVGVAIIFIAFILTGLYVRRANGEFDRLSREVKAELERELAKEAK